MAVKFTFKRAYNGNGLVVENAEGAVIVLTDLSPEHVVRAMELACEAGIKQCMQRKEAVSR